MLIISMWFLFKETCSSGVLFLISSTFHCATIRALDVCFVVFVWLSVTFGFLSVPWAFFFDELSVAVFLLRWAGTQA